MKKKVVLAVLILVFAIVSLAFACSGTQSVVDSLEVYTPPITSYLVGEEFDLNGAQLLVYFDDGSQTIVKITPDMISEFDPNKIGSQYIVVTYSGKTVAFEVTVSMPQLVDIDIDSVPTKNVYKQGQNLDLSGCTIQVKHANGSTEVITVTEDMVVLDSIDMNVVGVQSVTVAYVLDGVTKTASFDIDVQPKVLQSISITSTPTKNVYYVGESLEVVGGEMFLTYDNGYSERLSMTELSEEGNLRFEWDNTILSTRSIVTAIYSYSDPTDETGTETIEFINSFDVTVTERDVASVEVAESSGTSYKNQIVNLALNLNGLVLDITYNNGTSEQLVFSDDTSIDAIATGRAMVTGYNTSTIGYQTITITFFFSDIQLATTYDLELFVANKEINGIRLILPDGTMFNSDSEPKFYQDTPINPFTESSLGITGWKYVITYNNNTESEQIYDLTTSMLGDIKIRNGISYSEVGNHTWMMRFDSIDNIEFNFEIIPKRVVSSVLQIASNYKTFYGFDINTNGLSLLLTYNSGDEEIVDVESGMIKGFNKNSLGEQRITIVYKSKYTETTGFYSLANITTVRKVKDNYSLGYKVSPKNEYTRDSAFSLMGSEVNIIYDEGGREVSAVVKGVQIGSDWTLMSESPFSAKEIAFRNTDGWIVSSDGWDTNRVFVNLGTAHVTLSYEGLTSLQNGVTMLVNVVDPLQDITLVGNFAEMYSGMELDCSGVEIYLNYASGRKESIPVTSDMTNYNPRNTAIGVRKITISYVDEVSGDTFSVEAEIDVAEQALIGFEITKLPNKMEYLKGTSEEFSYDGMEVKFNFNNGSTIIEPVTYENYNEFIVENFDTTGYDGEIVEIKLLYDDQVRYSRLNYDDEIYATFTIRVRSKIVKSMNWVSNQPSIDVDEGKDINIATALYGQMLHVVFNDNSEEFYTVENAVDENDVGLMIIDYNKNTAIKQHVKLACIYSPEIYVGVEVSINARYLETLEVIANYSDMSVIEYSDINLDGIRLKLNYSNGTSEEVSVLPENINYSQNNPYGYDKNDTTTGSRQVNVTYTENGITKNILIDILVLPKELISISINTYPKLKYIEGEELDLKGGSIALFYNNGTKESVDMNDSSVAKLKTIRTKFDNNEFSGVSKLQTIYFTYTTGGTTFETYFDIIMQDRKDPEFVMDTANVYKFIYGSNAVPKFYVYGYSDYSDETASMLFGDDKLLHLKIEYINVNEYLNRDPNKDYTVLPTEVGEYRIVFTYDADPQGYSRDMIHNSIVYVAPDNLVINKRPIYIVADELKKVYGTENPEYTIRVMSEEKYNNPALLNDVPFAYSDTIYSPNFIQTEGVQSFCKTSTGDVVSSFHISCIDANGEQMAINTLAGSYEIVMSLGTSFSSNYDVRFVSAYMVISKRQVEVTPIGLSVEYGDRNISFKYTVTPVEGKEDTTGLFANDKLSGALSRMSPNDYSVGKYAVTVGTLANTNYQIIFKNDTTSNGGNNGVYLEIFKRKVYIKVNSTYKVYGDLLEEFNTNSITLYRDEACTVTKNALASTDTLDSLLGDTGKLVFTHSVSNLTDVGKYSVSVSFEGITTGSVIANYDAITITGYIEVTQMPITVVANAKSKTYGDDDPKFEYQLIETIPTGTLSGDIARQEGEYIGEYAITIGTLQSANPNYKINFTGATFTIISKVLVAKIDSDKLVKVFDGKVPDAPEFTVYSVDEEGTEVEVGASVDTSFITISIVDAKRDNGIYSIELSNSNPNYTVSFPKNTFYKYTINKLNVDVEIVIPEDTSYKGTSFVIEAYVPDEQLQKFYNSDGSVMLDENNKEVKDTVDVVVSFTTGATAISTGTYEAYVASLISENDNYAVNGRISKTFEITPRKLVVSINDNLISYDNVIEKEYTNQNITIKSNEYTVANLIPGSSDIVNFNIKVINQAQGLDTAKNVIFDKEGNIDMYDVTVVQPANTNYTVSLDHEYKVKITPKSAKITIADKFLSKTYDAQPPVILDFSKVATLQKANVEFIFTRDNNDGRTNSDVGVYNMSVKSLDPNHTVYLAKEYQYTINQVILTVALNSSEKSYDGTTITLQSNAVSISSFKGYSPVIRSFAQYSDGTTTYSASEAYAKFKNTIKDFMAKFDKNRTKANDIVFSDFDLANLRVEETLNTINDAVSYLNANEDILKTNTVKSLREAIDNAILRLNSIVTSSDLQNKENNLAKAIEYLETAYQLLEQENTYIAFIFSPSGTNTDYTAINAGAYMFELDFNDYNKTYRFSGNKEYTINRKEVYLGVKPYSVQYGSTTTNPVYGSESYYEYETYWFNGSKKEIKEFANFEPEFTRDDDANFNVGTYMINFDPDTTVNSKIGGNYIIVQDKTTYPWTYEVTKKNLTVYMDDVGYGTEDKIDYGTTVYDVVFEGRWTANEGDLVFGDVAEKVISTSFANYSARLIKGADQYDTTNIIGNASLQPIAGEYYVEVTNFISANYNVIVETSKLKISKKAITIANSELNDKKNIYRDYGYALIISFNGLAYNDNIKVAYNYTENKYEITGYFGANGGTLELPEFIYKTDKTSKEPFDLLTNNNEDDGEGYPVYFDWSDVSAAKLNNYTITEIGTDNIFYLHIDRADLILKVGSENSIIYGEVPTFNYEYTGFRNNESQASLGFSYPDVSGLAKKNTWDSTSLSSGDFVFTESDQAKLDNYKIIVSDDSRLEIKLRDLYVKLDKTISVLYDITDTTTPVKVGPYKYDSSEEVYLRDDDGVYKRYDLKKISSGQYSYSNITFYNGGKTYAGLINGTTADDLFQKYQVSESASYTNIIDYRYMFIHSLVYDQKEGENQKIKLTGLKLINDTTNYNIIYEETTLNVYSEPKDMQIDETKILLGENTIDDLNMTLTFEGGAEFNYTYGDLKNYLSTGSTTITSSHNINQSIKITYSRVAPLTGLSSDSNYSFNTITLYKSLGGDESQTTMVEHQYTVCEEYRYQYDYNDQGDVTITKVLIAYFQPSSSYIETTPDYSLSKSLVVRIYDDTTSSTEHLASNIATELDTTSETSPKYYTESNQNYDYVDAYIRMVPSKSSYGFAMYINSGATDSNNVLLVGDNNGYRLANGSGTTYQNLDLKDIDLFDGYTHNIKVYHSKQYNKYYIDIDGYALPIVTLNKGLRSNETSTLGIGFYGMKSYIRQFSAGFKGYYDTYATNVRGKESVKQTYVLTGSETYVSIIPSDLIGVVSATSSSYTYSYYLDGIKVDANSTNLFVGSHKLRLVVMDGENIAGDGYMTITVTKEPSVVTLYQSSGSSISSNIDYDNPTALSYTAGDNYSLNNGLSVPYITNTGAANTTVQYINQSGASKYTSVAIRLAMVNAKLQSNQNYRSGEIANSITLWGNDINKIPGTSTDSGYYSIAIGTKYNGSSDENNQPSTLIVTVGGKIFKYGLSEEIFWQSGDFYTIALYIDKNATQTKGRYGFKFVVYDKNNKLVEEITVNNGFEFNGGATIAQSELISLLETGVTQPKVSFRSTDTIFFFDKVQYNTQKTGQYEDYIDIMNNNYNYMGSSGLGTTIGSGKSLSLADNYGIVAWTRRGETAVQFAISGSFDNTKSVTVSLDTTNDITNKTNYFIRYKGNNLYFGFIYNGVEYKNQTIVSGLDLADGKVHTIIIKEDAEKMTEQDGTLGGLLQSRTGLVGTQQYIYYSRIHIFVDGEQCEKDGYLPYYNSVNYWYRQDGNSPSQGSYSVDSKNDSYMSGLVSTNISTEGTNVILYALSTQENSAGIYKEF